MLVNKEPFKAGRRPEESSLNIVLAPAVAALTAVIMGVVEVLTTVTSEVEEETLETDPVDPDGPIGPAIPGDATHCVPALLQVTTVPIEGTGINVLLFVLVPTG